MREPVTPPFQPRLALLSSLGSAFRVYFANANPLYLIVAILMIPTTILTSLLVAGFMPEGLANFDPTAPGEPFSGIDREEFGLLFAAGLLSLTITLIVSMIAMGACLSVVLGALGSGRPDWRTAMSAAFGKTGPLAWVAILITLLFIGGGVAGVFVAGFLTGLHGAVGALAGLALFVAFIYIFVSWSLALPVVMEDDYRGTRALGRSRELISGNWWPAFGVYLLGFLVILVVAIILGSIFNTSPNPAEANLVMVTIGNIVNNIVFTPFQAALVGVVYFHLRSRKPVGPVPGAEGGPPLPPPPPQPRIEP